MTQFSGITRRSVFRGGFALGAGLVAGSLAGRQAQAASYSLLNVSYDPTRELYVDVGKAFSTHLTQEHPGDVVRVRSSIGGSGAIVRAWWRESVMILVVAVAFQ